MPGKNKYAVVLILVLAGIFSKAQETSQPSRVTPFIREQSYRFELNNDEVIIGFVIDEDKEFVTVEKRPSFATVQIRKSTIITAKRMTVQEAGNDGPFGENHHAGMYLVSSSVMPFKKGTLSTTAHWFILDQIQYAFTDNLAVYATTFAFLPYGMGLKFSKPINDLTFIGADLSGMIQYGDYDSGTQVLGFMSQAKLTHGNSNRNFTIGGGFMGINPNVTRMVIGIEPLITTPVVSLGFCNRFAERWAIVMDGYYLTGESLLFGGCALKFLRDEQIAWSFGAYSHVNDVGGPKAPGRSHFTMPIPYLSYSRRFSY